MELSGWGRYPRALCNVIRPERVAEATPPAEGHLIARGQGRSYGDAAMSADGLVMLTEALDKVRAFDESTGLLTAQAGMTIAEVLRAFVPKGWFPSVTPGTKFVSLGGSVAADVHGKNHHHDGTFGAHVAELEIILADGSRTRCSEHSDAELFRATVGGMGLTGIITEVTFQLIPIETAYMIVQHHRARDLNAALRLLEDESWDEQYTVAWVDCLAGGSNLGRSIVMRGHHARVAELPESISEPMLIKPRGERNLRFDLPSWILNSLTASIFNKFYYRWQGGKQNTFVSDYDSYFYPLDAIGDWNRLYGKRGFVQYQCVLPAVAAQRGLQLLLEELARSRQHAFLSTLKRFGAEGSGLLSFPMAGYTLALDLPVGDASLFTFLDRLDEIVVRHGGRVYLAKDARLRAETFREMYTRFDEWQRIKAKIDPDDCFSSDLSHRLGMGAMEYNGR